MPRLSLVIPTYTATHELEQLAFESATSYRSQVHELIIVEDGQNYSEALRNIADVYIYCKENVGFSKNVNRGWKFATGDYVAIASSDTRLVDGDLDDLCIKGHVTSPEIVNQQIHALAGSFWVAPKEVTDKLGYLREEMRTYASDSEYEARTSDIFVKAPSVKIFHHQAKSVTAAGVEGGEEQRRDVAIYENLPKL